MHVFGNSPFPAVAFCKLEFVTANGEADFGTEAKKFHLERTLC